MMTKTINWVATLFIVLVMTACATQEQKPPTVFIPVVATKPALPARPRLEIADLSPDSGPDVVIRSYAQSVLQCQGYANQLEELLNAK